MPIGRGGPDRRHRALPGARGAVLTGKRDAGAERRRPGGGYARAMRLTRLALENWRNFRAADFPLGDRMVVVGPNAVGKSNLLDALRFLRQVASLGGGLRAAVDARGGMAGVRCPAAGGLDRGRVRMRVEMGGETDGRAAAYELAFRAEPRGLRRPVLDRETAVEDGEVRLDRPTAEDRADPERLTQTGLEQVNLNRGFREVVGFLRSVRYVNPVPQLLREPGRGGDRVDDPYGAGFLRRLARMPERTRARRLERIRRALRVAVPQFDDLEFTQDAIGSWHLNARFGHWRPGARHTESDLSDGTLRLVGVLWSLLEGKKFEGPVLLQQPERSLHPAIVRRLPEVLRRVRRRGGPQVILTTHSFGLLGDEGFGADEVVVLRPGAEGAEARLGSDFPDLRTELDAGIGLAEILGPATEPPGIHRLPGVFAAR